MNVEKAQEQENDQAETELGLRQQIRLLVEARLGAAAVSGRRSETPPEAPATLQSSLQQLRHTVSQLQSLSDGIGQAPPGPPTLRGAIGATLIRIFNRMLWWRDDPVQKFAAATHRCFLEQLQVLAATAENQQSLAEAVDVLRRQLQERNGAFRGMPGLHAEGELARNGCADASAQTPFVSWKELLYPGCIVSRWQMFDAERLALTALLYRLKPTCAIEVGSYYGGSLSLLAQHTDIVFSLDVDPGVQQRLCHLKNVSFVIGDSGETLPRLLEELTAKGMPVDLILIDGDHSYAGIRRDVSSVLRHQPLKPMLVLAHDSFNPECRRGLLEAGWSNSPYCHFVDLDFIPGQIVQYPGPSHGQMWGGLAAAYLAPIPREGDLPVAVSADALFRAAYASQYLQSGAAAGA